MAEPKKNTNHITIAQFRELTPEQRKALDTEQLWRVCVLADSLKKDAAKISKEIDTLILNKFGEIGAEHLKAAGKETGSVTFSLDNGYSINYSYPKKVQWDQGKLEKIVSKLKEGDENISDYVNINYEVEEKKFTAWPRMLQNMFLPARTVSGGSKKVEIIQKENESAD